MQLIRLTMLLGLLALLLNDLQGRTPLVHSLLSVRISGWLALGALMLCFACSAMAPCWSSRRPLLITLRRRCGLTAAEMAMVHLMLSLGTQFDTLPSMSWSLPYLRLGWIALCILVMMWLSSHTSIRRYLGLRRGWRQLHRIGHLALWMSLAHVLLAPLSDGRWVLTMLVCYLSLQMMKLGHHLWYRCRCPKTAKPAGQRVPAGSTSNSPAVVQRQ